ncbi:hypothetical protein M9H77_35970 [Catharanthus roseus]|uniref:Uncharacterized protein n=1 Tax=Catharanthus roseus TaxID=4058 RepID=A0ACB9ZRB7_CATRO|nr:hypothetical protein M9H77_35970 [Catharanthus roseus]
MGRDFQEAYESYEGSRSSYMDDGYGHWYPYEQEARITKGSCSYVDIGKKTSIGKPSGPWSKKSKNEEIARSQEVMLDKNDTCEGKKSHERRKRVEDRERINVQHCFLDAIPFLFEKVERDESEILEERKEGTMKEKESLFDEHERTNKEKGIESAKERHDKSSYSLELKLDSLLTEEICLLSNQINPFLALISSYMHNFLDKMKRIGGKHHHNHKETSISFSSSPLPLSIEFSFKELKLFLNAHGDATRDHSCDNFLYDSRMNDYYSYIANVDSFVLGFENKEECMLGVLENKGKSLEKELLNL